MGLTCRCTGCTASARRGVRRRAMGRLGRLETHACTPLFKFLEEGDRGIRSGRPVAPTSAACGNSGGKRANVRFAACHVPQGKVAHGWACGSVRWVVADVRVVGMGHPAGAIRDAAAAPHGSDAGRTRLTDGDPHAAQNPVARWQALTCLSRLRCRPYGTKHHPQFQFFGDTPDEV
jgi:hypothetical protein